MSVCANAAEMALVPVGASGPHEIVGNEIILYGADQVVTLEIYASDWQPWPINMFQASIDPRGATSGDAGTLAPLAWDRTGDEPVCETDSDCPEGTLCWRPAARAALGLCTSPNHHPEDGAFIDETRPDYVFRDLPALAGVDLSLWDPAWPFGFRFGALTLSIVSVVYSPPPKYCGTLTLIAPADAAGTFTMRSREGEDTFLADTITTYPHGNYYFPDLTPALITVLPAECGNGICDSGEDIMTCPEDCAPPPIPAASAWGLVVMALLVLAVARVAFVRRRRVTV
jgi:hypothetical protein